MKRYFIDNLNFINYSIIVLLIFDIYFITFSKTKNFSEILKKNRFQFLNSCSVWKAVILTPFYSRSHSLLSISFVFEANWKYFSLQKSLLFFQPI